MLNSEELFLFFIQKDTAPNGQNASTGYRHQYGESYENFTSGLAMPPQQLKELSEEVYRILEHMTKFERFHEAVHQYLLSESRLRKMEQSKFDFDLELLRSKLESAKASLDPAPNGKKPDMILTNHLGQKVEWT